MNGFKSLQDIIDGVGSSYTKLLLLISECGRVIYDGMRSLFNAIFFTKFTDLLEALEHVPLLGQLLGIMDVIFGGLIDQLFKDVTLFQLMIGPLCVMVIVFTVFKWLKDMT